MLHHLDGPLVGGEEDEARADAPPVPLRHDVILLVLLQHREGVLQQDHVGIHVEDVVSVLEDGKNELKLPPNLSLELRRGLVREGGGKRRILSDGHQIHGVVLAAKNLLFRRGRANT